MDKPPREMLHCHSPAREQLASKTECAPYFIDPALDRERAIVADLLNRGVIKVPASKGFTNVASINVAGKVAGSDAEYAALIAKYEAALSAATTDEARESARTDLELVKALRK